MSDDLLLSVILILVLTWGVVLGILAWLTDRGRWNGED